MNTKYLIATVLILLFLLPGIMAHNNHTIPDNEEQYTEHAIIIPDLPKGIYIVAVNSTKKPKK